jgi:hypothetical protein
MPIFLSWIVAITLAGTSAGLLLSRNWRWSLGLFVLQYFAAFWLLLINWPLNMAATVLVSGWMSAAALGTTLLNIKHSSIEETSWPQASTFRIFASGVVLLSITAFANSPADWFPIASLPLTWGALALIGLGILHLGMTLQPLRVILGLLTTLLGFEILYSTIENSILVTGLLVVVSMSLAFAGCYLLILGEQNA